MRSMILTAFVLMFGLATVSSANHHNEVATAKCKKAEKAMTCGKTMHTDKPYTCAMHTDVHSAKEGKCPICKMDLVHKNTLMKKMATSDLACSCTSGKKDAKCAACNAMKMTKDGKDVYYCPHHQQVMQNKPGKCSECSMDLKKFDPKTMKKMKKAK